MSKLNEQALPLDEAEVRAAVKQPKKKKKKKKGGAFGRFVRRTLLLIFTVVLIAAGGLIMVLNTVFNGPSEAARDVLTMSLSEASATKWVPGIFLGAEKVAEIRNKSGAALEEEFSDASQVIINKDGALTNSDEWKDYPDGIRIEDVSGDTYNAHVMIIRDPSTVYIACSNNGAFARHIPGARITEQIEVEGAIAAINAGAFFDNGTGTLEVGSTPEGLLISNGVVEWTTGSPPKGAGGFVGFTEDDILIVAKDMTVEEAEALGIRDGCEFGPVLIMNGEVNIEAYNKASGYNPRSAIGQRADGVGHEVHAVHQNSEAHHDGAGALLTVALGTHDQQNTNQCHNGREGLGLEHLDPDVVALDSRQRQDPCCQGRTNIGTHDNTDGLSQLHDTGVDQTHQHNGHSRRGLDGNSDARAKQKAFKGVIGHLLEKLFQLTAGHLLQSGGHDRHTIQKEGQTTAECKQGKNIHTYVSFSFSFLISLYFSSIPPVYDKV